jgi:phosphate transport system substrate-binding protein
MKNKPTVSTSSARRHNFKAAAAGADWNKTFYQILTEQPGKDSLADHGCHLHPDAQGCRTSRPARQLALKFFDWAYATATRWPMTWTTCRCRTSVKELVRKQWGRQIKDASGKPVAFK